MFVGDLVEEEAEGKNDCARNDPIDVAPKHSRLVEERAKGRARSQQPDRIENAQQAKVNQRQVARPAAKTEKSDCSESGRQNSDGGRNVGELPAQLRARERNHGLSQEKRACVRRVGHVGLNCIQVTIRRASGPQHIGTSAGRAGWGNFGSGGALRRPPEEVQK